MKTLKIEAGENCKIDAGNVGVIVEGPALIICVKEKDLDKPSPNGVDN